MATKNIAAQASKKKSTISLSRRSYGASVTSSSRAHTMETKSMAKAAAPSPSELDELKTQQKESSWMDEIQNL